MFQTGNHEIVKDSAQSLPEALRERFESTHTVMECLGAGRVTQVYLLREEATGQLQALKILNPRCRADAVVKRRFSRACLALIGLRHEHILRVLEIAPPDFDEPYMLTRYHGRNSLADMMQTYRAMHESDAVSIFYALSRALHFAHEYGVVHGGLEPTDIFILRGDFLQLKPVLADFGMSLVGADFNSSTRGQALTGESFGNVRYMSPEQCRGEAPSAKSDIYSLGCLMFEALSGQPAFALGTPLEVMLSHASGSSDFLIAQLAARDISEPLVQIVSSMLAPQPGQRPASMGAVAARLKELIPPSQKDRPKLISPQSISAEIKAKRVSKQLSNTSGRMLLRGATVPPLSPPRVSNREDGERLERPQGPLGRAQTPADPSQLKLQQDKNMRLKRVVMEPDDHEEPNISPRLVEAKDRPDPAPALVPFAPQKPPSLAVAPSSSSKPDRKGFVPLRAVLTDPYVVVAVTVVASVFVLTLGAPFIEQIRRYYSELPVSNLYHPNDDYAMRNLDQSLNRQIGKSLSILRSRYNAGQRLMAANTLSDLGGLNRTVYHPEIARFILLQPDRFSALVESGALEVDEEVRPLLVDLVHSLAADDTFGREYLMETLRSNKHQTFNNFVIDASVCPESQRKGKAMDKLEVALIKHLLGEDNAEISQAIMRAILVSEAEPVGEAANILNELARRGDPLKRDFAKRMLRRTKDVILLPMRPDEY
ncbi:MAG: protein kinase [Candidatus Obscuribacter sp.]|nr:protein kinase [Candidatus Obscuribacter sp.]